MSVSTRFVRFALLASCCSVSASAQSFTLAPKAPQLSPPALEKLKAMEAFSTLPAVDWRFHAGDLPHGESADDSTWATVQAGPKGNAAAGPALDAAWYRRTIEVPKTVHGYDIAGSRVMFQFVADANGPVPEIIYFNGRRVALGDDLEPIVLFAPAKPGEKVEVAVKLLRTVDAKRFRGATLAIVPAEGAGARPNPDDLRIECLSAARLLPALAKPRTDLLPRVEEAIAQIDLNALDKGDQGAFDASLLKAQQTLNELRPVLREARIILAGNSHIDAAWLWPESETIDVVKRTFTTALQLMNEYPNYTYTQSAAQYTEWMADKYPKLHEQIRERVKEGRWEIVGGMWVEPDLNLPDGESLVRQLLIGQQEFKKDLGVTARIGWNPDSFGYTWQLPQIYKRSGLDYFVTQKMHWNDTNQLPFGLFWWESPDGSKVLTYFPTDYVHMDLSPARLSADFAQMAARNPGVEETLDLYGVGDHGGGPTRAMLDQGDRFIASGKPAGNALAVPTMRYGTAQQYFSRVEKTLNPVAPMWNYDRIAKGYRIDAPPAGKVSLPTWKDELYFEFHRGVFTTQAKHKENMRRSEVATLDAEKLASLAWLAGQPYPNAAFIDSWKKVTFNQFHDLAAGSGIGVIYRDAQKEYTEVFHADHEIAEDSLKTLAAGIDTRVKAGVPILLFNSLAWSRPATVRVSVQMPEHAASIELLDAADHVVPSQVIGTDAATNRFDLLVRVQELPAMGYTVLHAVAAGAQQPKGTGSQGINAEVKGDGVQASEDGGGFTLENGLLRVRIDRKSGCVTSLKTLPKEVEYLAANGCGNQLQTFKDTPKQYDAWNIDPGTLDHNTPIENVDSIAIVDHGGLRKTVKIERTWQASHFVQEISLDASADTVDIANQVDWHETHVLLKAAFPLAATGPKATYEIPYGSIERTTTRNNSWEKAQFEVPAMRWADLGDALQGVSLLNDSKYGYDAVGNTLRLSLLRSPASPDPDADRGLQSFRYALYPHAATWKHAQTMHRGYELNYPVVALQVAAHTGSLPAAHTWASVEDANVVLTAVKKAEGANALIFRMFEWAGEASTAKLHVPAGATSATETNLMEKPEGGALSVHGDTLTVNIKPYEIKTVRVDYKR